MVGVIKGRLGATRYQGRYHVIHGGSLQGPHTGVVIARIDHLGGFPLAPIDPMPIFALFGLEGPRGLHSCAPVE